MLINLIMLLLVLASLLIGGALALLGSPSLGVAVGLIAVVMAGLLRLRTVRDWLSATPRWLTPVAIGAAAGSALTVLIAGSNLAPLVETAVARPAQSLSEDYRLLNLFGNVFDVVRADYVDKPDDAKLISSAISGMVDGLDPHSNYMDTKSFGDMQVDTNGRFGGLGMEVTMTDNQIKVVSPIDNTPAAKAGILAGDIISKVDDQPVKGVALDKVVTQLRGPVGSKVKIEVIRKDQAAPLTFTLTRQIIKIQSVKDRAEATDVGYIRITQFNDLTTDELHAALKDLASKIPEAQLKGYILDLRNNPGGLLDQAVSVSDAFLDRGEIVSIRGRAPDNSERFDAKPGDLIHGKPLIVLVNGGTASAAEIVSGALQDHKRATILGTRSFGKGSVQTIIPLGAGNGALRLTTARYYTPSGRSIQALGITPDVQVLEDVPKDIADRMHEVSEASLRGHLKASGAEEKGSQAYVPPKPEDDKALQMALALLRGTQHNPAFPPNPNEQARAN